MQHVEREPVAVNYQNYFVASRVNLSANFGSHPKTYDVGNRYRFVVIGWLNYTRYRPAFNWTAVARSARGGAALQWSRPNSSRSIRQQLPGKAASRRS